MRFEVSCGFRVRSQLDFRFEAVALVPYKSTKSVSIARLFVKTTKATIELCASSLKSRVREVFFVYIVRQTFDK